MPNGYGPAIRIFTKITKIPFTLLRKKGHVSVVYVDDSYLQGKVQEQCLPYKFTARDIIKTLLTFENVLTCLI